MPQPPYSTERLRFFRSQNLDEREKRTMDHIEEFGWEVVMIDPVHEGTGRLTSKAGTQCAILLQHHGNASNMVLTKTTIRVLSAEGAFHIILGQRPVPVTLND